EQLPEQLVERLRRSLITSDEFVSHRLGVLGWLVREGRLEVRVAIAHDAEGRPLPGEEHYFHEKIGVAYDGDRNGIAFTGSANDSVRGWMENFENIDVFPGWTIPAHFNKKVQQFERHWSGEMKRFRVFQLPEALRRELVLKAAPERQPPLLDIEEKIA